MLDKLFYS